MAYAKRLSSIFGKAIVEVNSTDSNEEVELDKFYSETSLGDYYRGLLEFVPDDILNLPIVDALDKLQAMTDEEWAALYKGIDVEEDEPG